MDYRDWILRAKSSYFYAKAKVSEEVYYADKCYQAQQAVEKAFKGLLVYFGVDYPYTHNIRTLLDIIQDYVKVEDYIKKSAYLTTFAVDTRYSSPQSDVPEEVYEDAIRIAKDCIDWVEETIEDSEKKKG